MFGRILFLKPLRVEDFISRKILNYELNLLNYYRSNQTMFHIGWIVIVCLIKKNWCICYTIFTQVHCVSILFTLYHSLFFPHCPIVPSDRPTETIMFYLSFSCVYIYVYIRSYMYLCIHLPNKSSFHRWSKTCIRSWIRGDLGNRERISNRGS
jgi:hypothetical protein